METSCHAKQVLMDNSQQARQTPDGWTPIVGGLKITTLQTVTG